MSDAASVSIKNLLGLAAVIIVSGILINGTTGIFQDVQQASKVAWIDNTLKPAVMDQCSACFIGCGGGEDPNPKTGTFNQQFENSHEMYLEWKGDNNNRLHLVTENEEGEVELSVRIAVSQNLALRPDRGCQKPSDASQYQQPDNLQAVTLIDNTDGPGLKQFKIRHNGVDCDNNGGTGCTGSEDWQDVQSRGRGALIVIE